MTIQGKKSYKIVSATGWSLQDIEDECNLEAEDLYLLHSTLVIGGTIGLIFAQASILK